MAGVEKRMNYKISLVSDDRNICSQVMVYCLEYEGFQVNTSGIRAIAIPSFGEDEPPNLWILDVDAEEGFTIMKQVKDECPAAGIILLSEHERVVNRVLGLELGCDDFILKPFDPRELVIRVKRVKEKRELTTSLRNGNRFKLQEFWLDPDRHLLIRNEQTIGLTTKEFEILALFARNSGIALSRRQIIQYVWGDNYFGSDRVVDDLIRRIRKKIERLEVETLYGYGYRVYA